MPRIFADHYSASRRGGLHPRSEVGHMSNRRVLGVSARVDHAENYFARVDPDTDLDPRSALLFELLAATAKRVAHRHRRVQRPLRMVLVSDRRPEQREDAIAGRLHDVTVVAMRRVDHQLQRGVDNRASLFRIEVAHQLGRTLDIREQRRHRLALAVGDVKAGWLWNRLRRECRLYRANRPLGRWFSEWRRAPAAESEADWIFGAAFRATLRHRSGALATKSHPLRIVEAAGVAEHVSRPLMKLDVLCLSGCFS